MEFLQARWGCENPSPRRRRTTDPPALTPPRPLCLPTPTLPSPLQIKKKKPGWAGLRRVEEGEERMDGRGSGTCRPNILAAAAAD